jgi:hypothetical protein
MKLGTDGVYLVVVIALAVVTAAIYGAILAASV